MKTSVKAVPLRSADSLAQRHQGGLHVLGANTWIGRWYPASIIPRDTPAEARVIVDSEIWSDRGRRAVEITSSGGERSVEKKPVQSATTATLACKTNVSPSLRADSAVVRGFALWVRRCDAVAADRDTKRTVSCFGPDLLCVEDVWGPYFVHLVLPLPNHQAVSLRTLSCIEGQPPSAGGALERGGTLKTGAAPLSMQSWEEGPPVQNSHRPARGTGDFHNVKASLCRPRLSLAHSRESLDSGPFVAARRPARPRGPEAGESGASLGRRDDHGQRRNGGRDDIRRSASRRRKDKRRAPLCLQRSCCCCCCLMLLLAAAGHCSSSTLVLAWKLGSRGTLAWDGGAILA
jgi:hypothetical protein